MNNLHFYVFCEYCSVSEIKVNEEYSVGFLSDGRQLMINVYLGSNFPNEKPRIVVSPLVKHPWINDQTGEVQGAPGLLNVRTTLKRNRNFSSNLSNFSLF